MSDGELADVDVRRSLSEWVPPLNATRGPPAHALYADLVVYGDMGLFRDAEGRPWVLLRDGMRRRAFAVPSPELHSAVDRFRMRRAERVLPDGDFEEFVRVIEARVSDPDAEIPRLPSSWPEGRPFAAWPLPGTVPTVPDPPGRYDWRISPRLPGAGPHEPGRSLEPRSEPELIDTPKEALDPETRVPSLWGVPLDDSRSGARSFSETREDSVSRYVQVFRRLVGGGSWMGTTRELSELTEEDPVTLFDFQLRHGSELAKSGVLVANIEVDGDYRWLAVDRAKVHEPRGEPSRK